MRSDAEQIVQTYADLVARVSYGYLGRLEDVQDICHDVLLKALTRTEPFESDEHEKAWMIRAAINTSKKYLTRAERRLADSYDDMSEVAPAIVDSHDDELYLPDDADLSEAIAALPPVQREAILLRYWADYSVAEIANITGASAGAISMRLARARTSLHRILTGAHHD
ncbi:MAG: sigma-70 family RNA polymerase sigma factor [Actinomycetaceae bacterium]|nr:sigma-70 family RNA polymerase sigma factor [Actinomycetaceae bacterium]